MSQAETKSSYEGIVDPGQVIIDAHHHLYDRPNSRYLAPDMLADLARGHDIRATVFVQARSMLRTEGPEKLKSLGETQFANGIASRYGHGLCSAIVGQVDLTLGSEVISILEAHLDTAFDERTGNSRFRGVRHVAAWDPDLTLLNPAYITTEDLLDTTEFRQGFSQLSSLGLSFDAWILFHQIPRLTSLARSFPQANIVLNHCGGIVGVGRYAAQKELVYAQWLLNIRELAACSNVKVKLGGLGMPLCGIDPQARENSPFSDELASAWKPWIEPCIELFGPERCMFESNFPADRVSYDYGTGWNAMKKLVANASQEDKDELFWRSAAGFYGLSLL